MVREVLVSQAEPQNQACRVLRSRRPQAGDPDPDDRVVARKTRGPRTTIDDDLIP